jgi:hypothetical protein
VPANTGTRPSMVSTATCSSASYSASVRAFAFAGRAGDHDGLGAGVHLIAKVAAPGVEIELAARRERRGQRGDTAGEIQSGASVLPGKFVPGRKRPAAVATMAARLGGTTAAWYPVCAAPWRAHRRTIHTRA